MDFYIKQRVFSFGDKFDIYDYDGNVRYRVEGEVFSFGKKLHVYSPSGDEVCYVEQKLWSFLPKYTIYKGNDTPLEVVKEFTFFKQLYHVEPIGWEVRGNFFDYRYEILNGEKLVASVEREWFTFGDAYRISITSFDNEVAALAVVLVIDACIEAQRD